jgi:hypothetical protein
MYDNNIYIIDPTGPSIVGNFAAPPTLSWGLGHEQNLWITETNVLYAYEYTYAGSPTGNSFYALQGGATWMGDASEWWPDGEIWILAVGGTNRLYKFAVPSGTYLADIGEATWTYISQRGVTYDPFNDKFWVGGWNSNMVWEINSTDGSPTGRSFPFTSIASLAYDWQSTLHNEPVLWVATNAPQDYIYMVDPDNPQPAQGWDFETGLQGWTHTNGQAYPAGWDVEAAATHGSLPDAGDSTMWVDSDAGGASFWIQDSALSPVCVPGSGMDWLKYGFFNYGGSSGYVNELHVGIKHSTGGVWTATELAFYPSGVPSGPAWDSVDVSAYASADYIQVYYYFDDLDTWGYYAAFDNVLIDAMVAHHDVGTTAILEPVGTHFLNDVVTPTTTVKNHGNFEETFPVIFNINHNAALVYADTVAVTLAAGAIDTVNFNSYTLAETGTYSSVSYTELVGDENPGNDTTTAVANVYAGLIPYVIIDVDPTPLTGPWLHTMFQSWGVTGVYTTSPATINADSLSLYQTAWICTGIYSNYYSYSTAEATAIGDYLATGRSAYFEGGDAWGFVSARTVLCPLFGIDPTTTTDGTNDLYTVGGVANGQIPQVAGNNWTYAGENNYIDHLGLYATPPNGGTVEGFLQNPSVYYWTGAAYDQGTWKGVALSHELAGNQPGTVPSDSLLSWIAQYLNLPVGIEEQPVGHDVQAFGFAPRMSTLANGHVPITYTTTVSGLVSLQVYDGAGRLVQTLVHAQQPAGEKSFVWNRTDINGRKVANGVYFCRLQADNRTATHKLVLVD